LLAEGAIVEAACPHAWLTTCEAMACINSGVFIQPVVSIDGRLLDANHKALEPLFEALAKERGVRL